ncbi:MAG: hypothetical protein M4579_002481 [Chaenotheca gracillima]|nr:MAG: hypothetical protein M4579_002481 [Chaenotheca gracillima]
MASPQDPVRRRLAGVSLKMYFDIPKTEQYLRAVSKFASHASSLNVDAFVIPDFVTILRAQQILDDSGTGTGIKYGAQDAFWEASGAYTGEVSPAVLRQAGCTYVELGHAERRRIFGETDEQVAKKAGAATREGLVPLVCIGERTRGADAAQATALAVEECRPQVESVLSAVPDDAEVVLAYEPVWAIGQSEPASAEHVVAVTKELRKLCKGRKGLVRILYGGSAGPGLFAKLAEGVDGLFLGRFAHDPEAFRSVISELAQA